MEHRAKQLNLALAFADSKRTLCNYTNTLNPVMTTLIQQIKVWHSNEKFCPLNRPAYHLTHNNSPVWQCRAQPGTGKIFCWALQKRGPADQRQGWTSYRHPLKNMTKEQPSPTRQAQIIPFHKKYNSIDIIWSLRQVAQLTVRRVRKTKKLYI